MSLLDRMPRFTDRELIFPAFVGVSLGICSICAFTLHFLHETPVQPVVSPEKREAVPPFFARYIQGRIADEEHRTAALQREIDSLSAGVLAAKAEMERFREEGAAHEAVVHDIQSHIDGGIGERWQLEDSKHFLHQDMFHAKQVNDQIASRLYDLKIERFRRYLKEKR
ncbi:MAG: hypothetical protein OYG31_03025 [Candidatus Kaiserbacteria bacterium]|nr:hypothetical protein [Candidatus Kaiserbacteria bacterium]